MLENLTPASIFAASVVITSLTIISYFSWKTLTTNNFFQKGVALYQKKDYSGAEEAFRKVISINSTNDVVRLLLGDIFIQQNKIDEATEMFTDVIRRSPKNPDAYLRLSGILMQQEKREDAINNLQTARDLFKKQRQPQKAEQINSLLEKMVRE
ncbi:MAG: tetratricopeptide repeat protein [Scytonematopsis contorta HA4267-MV1]|jgi:TolA-binding protein|nr:tetratricopeptide repeat protein [Scytonematopsis contorta HA4267-MV1]